MRTRDKERIKKQLSKRIYRKMIENSNACSTGKERGLESFDYLVKGNNYLTVRQLLLNWNLIWNRGVDVFWALNRWAPTITTYMDSDNNWTKGDSILIEEVLNV